MGKKNTAVFLIFFVILFFALEPLWSYSSSESDICVAELSPNCEYGLLIKYWNVQMDFLLVRISAIIPLKYNIIDTVSTEIWPFSLFDDGSAAYIDRKFSGLNIVERNLMLFHFDSDKSIDTLMTYKAGDTTNKWLMDIDEFELDLENSLIAYSDEEGIAVRKLDFENRSNVLIRSFPNGRECRFTDDHQQLLIVKPVEKEYPLYNNILVVYDIKRDSICNIFENTNAIVNPRRLNKAGLIYFVDFEVGNASTDICSVDNTGTLDFRAAYNCPYHVSTIHLFSDSIIVYVEPCKYPDTTKAYYDVIRINWE